MLLHCNSLCQSIILAVMKFRLVIYSILFLGSADCLAQDFVDSAYTHPLKSKSELSGTFGELRLNHFHSGIDLKTEGKCGKPVFSIDQGYISRIKISSSGFGRAIYLNHRDNKTSVYAHLQCFSYELDSALTEWLRLSESNELDTILQANDFPVSKGDCVGYSGNSGSSLGPHLHFEMRHTQSEIPFNPYSALNHYKDTIGPQIKKLIVYDGFTFDTSQRIEIKDVGKQIGNQWHYTVQDTLILNDCFAFGLQTFDYNTDSTNQLGVLEIMLSLDDESLFHVRFEEFSFSESRYANSCMDYASRIKDEETIYRLHTLPGNYSSLFRLSPSSGIYCPPDEEEYVPLRIQITDQAGNASILNATLALKSIPSPRIEPEQMILHNEPLIYNQNGFTIEFEANALYYNTPFSFETDSLYGNLYFTVLSELTPIHKKYSITSPLHIQSEGMGVYGMNSSIPEYITSLPAFHALQFSSHYHGRLAILCDSISPEIGEIIWSYDSIFQRPQIEIFIDDNMSGLDQSKIYINDRFAPAYYDRKTKILSFPFTCKMGESISILIEAMDKAGNRTRILRNSIRNN